MDKRVVQIQEVFGLNTWTEDDDASMQISSQVIDLIGRFSSTWFQVILNVMITSYKQLFLDRHKRRRFSTNVFLNPYDSWHDH